MTNVPHPLTVEQIVPLVEALPPAERARLLRLILASSNVDSSINAASPPSGIEFSTGEELLAWDSDGWEDVA